MNGTENGHISSGLGPQAENFDAVMGRFQSWAKARKVLVSDDLLQAASRPVSLSEPVKFDAEAREISYEQALQASRYRRPVEIAPAEIDSPDPLAALPPANTGGRSPTDVSASPSSTTGSSQRSRSKKHRAKPTLQRDTILTPAPSGCKTELVATGQSTKEIRAPKPATRKTGTRLQKTPKVLTQPQQPIPPSPHLAFRNVLENTMAPPAVYSNHSPAVLERSKSVSVTLRVSDHEQARIQACAAQANLTVSAYLRQCALGVDSLRDQVKLALAELHQQQAKVAAVPQGLSEIPGILWSFGMNCFRRLRRKGDGFSSLSLR